MLRNATIFAHWGYMGLNNFSFTNYGADSFDREYIHHVYQPEGHLSKLGLHPCYDPKKVMASEVHAKYLLFMMEAVRPTGSSMHVTLNFCRIWFYR